MNNLDKIREKIDKAYLSAGNSVESLYLDMLELVNELALLDGLGDGWVSVDDDPPHGDELSIKLKDGTVINNVLPQADGDYYWKSPFGEVFICELSVTHWMPLPSAPR